MWCKVVTGTEEAANEKETVPGKELGGSKESGSPGVDHVSARSLQNRSHDNACLRAVKKTQTH